MLTRTPTHFCLAHYIALLFAVAINSPLSAEEPIKSIDVETLRHVKVIGRLGVPLGTVVPVEVEIISGDSLRTKRDAATYLLKVLSVEGRALDQPPVLNFGNCPGTPFALPNNSFALYEFRKGKEAEGLNDKMIKEIEKGFVGKKLTLLVYESGGFHGVPDLPPEVADWQDVGFGFSTHLKVLDRVKLKEALPAKGEARFKNER